jgi:hypothetical protein
MNLDKIKLSYYSKLGIIEQCNYCHIRAQSKDYHFIYIPLNISNRLTALPRLRQLLSQIDTIEAIEWQDSINYFKMVRSETSEMRAHFAHEPG